MVRKLFLAAIIMVASIGVLHAEKSGFCVTTADAMGAVRKAGETIIFRGLSKRGHLVTIYLSKESQTFTALIHYKDGRSCFVDFGGEGEVMEVPGERS